MRLVSEPGRSSFAHVVVTLQDYESVQRDAIEAAGVRVYSAGAKAGGLDPRMIYRLARIIRRERPAVVQTWMYHADLVGGLAAKLAGRPPVAWNIRNGTLAPEFSKPMTLRIARISARLSRLLPATIVCCAESAKLIHAELGYDAGRMTVIPNGYDLDRFQRRPEAGRELRARAGIGLDVPVIGMVARFHPQKDFFSFFAAARRVGERFPEVRFLLCGEDVSLEEPELRAMIEASGLGDRVHLLGEQRDIPAVYSAMDISCLTSRGGEGFPNAVAEAMACETPCVVTDVGDAALIAGETGRVVPIGEIDALTGAMMGLLALSPADRQTLGKRARQRIESNYTLDLMRSRYEAVYERLAGSRERFP
jgi:glycosyltransferase involved in cell wall biosynthesis